MTVYNIVGPAVLVVFAGVVVLYHWLEHKASKKR